MDEKSLHSDVSPTQHRNLKSLRWINLWRFMKLKDREGEQEDILAKKGDQKHPVWPKHKTEWKKTCAPVQTLLHPCEQEVDTTGDSDMSEESPNTVQRSSHKL